MWLSSGNGVQKLSRNKRREKQKQQQLIGCMALLVPKKGYLSTPVTAYQTCHNRLGGGHFLAMVAHILETVGLHWWLLANCCMSY
jgi:hypothetical protein